MTKTTDKPTAKRADDLKPGDWTIWSGAPIEITHTQPFRHGTEPRVLVVYADAQTQTYLAADSFTLASAEQVAAARYTRERTEEIAKLREFVTWLDAHPDVPAPGNLRAQASLFGPWLDQLATLQRAAEAMGLEIQRSKSYDGRPTAKVELEIGNVDFVVYASDDRRDVERRCETCGEDLDLIEAGRLDHVPGEACATVAVESVAEAAA